jgi:hypothetical protein
MQSIDINIIYNEIIEKLQISNNAIIISELEKSAAGAVTGSEALMGQGAYLLSLQYNEPLVFKIIEPQINSYLNYCKQNGLIIH